MARDAAGGAPGVSGATGRTAGVKDGRAGIGIFVKTPGLSPLKTRLAATLGAEATLRFYRLAAASVRAAALAAGDAVAPYWAVAEAEALAHPEWAGLPTLPQGEGGLGERMAAIYAALLERHGRAILIGADAPQVTPGLLRDAVRALDASPYVIGPAEDGGFWLFGGRAPVPDAVWTGVAYSRDDTAARFLAALAPHGGGGAGRDARRRGHGGGTGGARCGAGGARRVGRGAAGVAGLAARAEARGVRVPASDGVRGSGRANGHGRRARGLRRGLTRLGGAT
ncbi:DUF2064 domain-containing protein [Roseomonas sp. CCTCC AB2023176]|uniref:TIGR04282 family arsenosugar biosynthesis glycosyltransferase n=1 Tax=Roseomonas sp. CCTCC AB2023176 TaxID=3342640 RepID=UPI0035D91F72